jgi:HEAT repeat protein/Flp pilus assembly protein TadD
MAEINLKKVGHWLLKPCTRRLIGFLSHQNPQLRNEAAKALAEISDEEAVSPLIDCLFRESQGEQIPLALAQFKNSEALEALLHAFKNTDGDIKPNIAIALGAYKEKKVVNALIEGLNDLDSNVRFNCISSLGKLQANEAVPHLLACIGEANEWIFLNVVNSLARIGDHHATQTLTSFYTKERNERKRSAIIAAFGSLKDLTSIPTLTKALNDDDDRVKANAIESLSNLNVPGNRIISLIEPFLKHQNNRVRGNAIIAADKLGSIDLTPTLLEMKDSPSKLVRATLAFTLQKIEHVKAISIAIELLQDPDRLVRTNAATALTILAREAQSETIIKLLNDENNEVKLQGISIIGKLRIKTAAQWLTKLYTENADSTLRSAIVTSLGLVGSTFDAPILEEALCDRNARVRANAIESIESILGEKSISILRNMLKDTDNRVKANAANSLFKLGSIEVLDNLEKMLGSSDLSTKLSAVYTVGHLGKTINGLCSFPFETPLKKRLEAIDLNSLSAIQQTFDSLPRFSPAKPKEITASSKPSSTEGANPKLSSQEEERNKILALAKEDKLAEAYILSTQYLQSKPNDLMMVFYAGNTAFKLESFNDAIKHFKKATELDIFNVQAYSNLGMALFKGGKLVEATEVLQKALTLQPSYTTIRYNLANIFLKLGKYNEAARSFEEGLKYDKHNSKILNNLAYAYNRLGNFQKSAEIYRRVISMTPDDAGAYYNLSVTLIKLNKKEEAIQLLRRATAMVGTASTEHASIQSLLERLTQKG